MSVLDGEGRSMRGLFLGLLLGAVVLGLALWVVFRPGPRESAQASGTSARTLTLVAPRGDLETAPSLFEWRPVEGALRYTVKIEDADAVWPLFVRSSESPSLSLAPQEASALLPGRVHVWEVQALDGEGRVIASGGTRFRIRAPLPPS